MKDWSSYRVGRKHERENIKKDLMKLVEEKKTKTEIVQYIKNQL
jgi:hypothetical protein